MGRLHNEINTGALAGFAKEITIAAINNGKLSPSDDRAETAGTYAGQMFAAALKAISETEI
jgi:hypothetical protein